MFPLQGMNPMSSFASSGMMLNPIAMLFQGLQQMLGGGQQGGCQQQGPGQFGNSPFGCCPGGAANLSSSFGGDPYQAGFQQGMQAAQGGGPQNAYQAGFQQGMQAAQGGFGGPGFANQGFGGGNPLAQILSLLMQLMSGGGGGPFGGGMPGGGFQPPFGGGMPGGGMPGGGFNPSFGGGGNPGGNFFPNQGGGNFPPSGPVQQQSLGNPAIQQLYNGASGNGQALRFKAGMQIDCDGSGPSFGDPCFQGQTSARLANGRSLDATHTPFVVLPPQLAKQYGVKLGDLCLVRNGDKVSPAIFGDVGPRNKLGEGSVRLAQNLGINASPTRGGTSGGVEYQVFPGSGRGVKLTNENTSTEALWERVRGLQQG